MGPAPTAPPEAPANPLAMPAIDLLYGDAGPARQVLADYQPRLSKEAYLKFQRDLFATERYKAEDGAAVTHSDVF